ncbi:VOC family protein [Mesorhizobium sp. Cs1299R1N3]|uniref:VOC family protein n=1 Tax=Mesorhizobium sp. Cs1299R1N3 TaxID=3015173 RepID=UPI00301BACA3
MRHRRARVRRSPCSCGVNSLLLAIHHIAIICSDYELSKQFYNKLDFVIVDENWRAEKQSWKCDLRHGPVRIEPG